MPYGTMEYFVDEFLVRWSGSTLHKSIYLSQQLELRKGLTIQMYMFYV